MHRGIVEAGSEESPPVHDVRQSVHANRVGGEQGRIEDSGRRHHHEGEPILHKHVTHLGEEKGTE